MYVVQISDRDTFAMKAKALQHPVTVVPAATVVPVEQSGAVVMHPALAVDYSLEFDDPSMGETRWTFREVVLTDERGQVMLTDSLWGKLKAEPPAIVRVIHRGGPLL